MGHDFGDGPQQSTFVNVRLLNQGRQIRLPIVNFVCCLISFSSPAYRPFILRNPLYPRPPPRPKLFEVI